MEAENTISEKLIQLPQKRFYRQRAHSNPLAHHTFDYPACPAENYWDSVYPDRRNRQVRILDIGCGYGGLLIQVTLYAFKFFDYENSSWRSIFRMIFFAD